MAPFRDAIFHNNYYIVKIIFSNFIFLLCISWILHPAIFHAWKISYGRWELCFYRLTLEGMFSFINILSFRRSVLRRLYIEYVYELFIFVGEVSSWKINISISYRRSFSCKIFLNHCFHDLARWKESFVVFHSFVGLDGSIASR